VKARGDVARLTAPVRRAYRALRESKVPTIAAIHGNCFGCGVELALQCRHRVAVDDGPTCFYMTEIADYLFVPCFGATQDLPRVVGLDAAIRLVVGGERWTARDAVAGGLVDRIVPARGCDEAIRAMALEVKAGRMRSLRVVGFDPMVGPRARARAAALPEAQRMVAERAIDLLERGALGQDAYDDEIVAAEQSVARPESKAAQGFFFVRQIAAARERRASAERVSSIVVAGLPRLGDALARTAPVELPIVLAPAPRMDPHRLLVASSDGPGVDVVLSTGPRPPLSGTRARAWAPFLASGSRFVEIDGETRPEVAAALALALQRAGFETATTRPADGFVSERLICALLDPIEWHLACGGSLADATAALARLGIVRPLRVIAQSIGVPLAPLTQAASAEAARTLDVAIGASLVAIAVDTLARGVALHPATLDVVARHAIDFPLSQRSLTSYATVARARGLLEQSRGIEAVTDSVRAVLEAHVRGGRDVWS
jgi:enoyl-CoA hydratase/carnithine racemase